MGGLPPPLGDPKEGWKKSEKIGKEGWNHEKRAKTAKIWLEIMKRRLDLARGLDPPPQPQNFTPPLEKKWSTRMNLTVVKILTRNVALSNFCNFESNMVKIPFL